MHTSAPFDGESAGESAPETMRGATRNRLSRETSPYLLQHAGNPVDWYPWGKEALDLAKRENKPILLSIGYSACHWCHVMAHESFEDASTAAAMNALFVNIKVDREERPDLDRIYQIAHQMLIQRGGGWPLTMFLSPHDQHPFFGGTYFPRDARYGMPSFRDLLQRVAQFYRDNGEKIEQQSAALQHAFAAMLPPPSAALQPFDAHPLQRGRELLAESFDAEFGGFGNAPKFPHPTHIEFLLRRWRATAASDAPDLHSLYMATLTLTRMAEGGIYDQLGGGFARYSVDQYWMIPHFEKMLYDNGPLLQLYAHAALATGDPLFRRIAGETADWLLRDMQSPQGGYWSALDADSEGHEGRFYVWDEAHVRTQLSAEQHAVFAKRFGLDRAANFEGRWHLHAYRSVEEIANELSLTEPRAQQLLDEARHKLLALRATRIRPARDEKILTAWNGLAIAGMATAARALARADLVQAAQRAIDFIRTHCWREQRLLAAHKDGQARFPAYLDDYAFLLGALLESLQTHWRSEDLAFAMALADTLLDHFEDREHGGFFFTADDHEALIHRSKSFGDEALPAGNAIAAQTLTRLGLLLGNTRYLQAASATLRAAGALLEQYPHAHTGLLVALEEQLQPPRIVIIRGPAEHCEAWRAALAQVYAPRRLVFAIPSATPALPAALADKTSRDETVAYICEGMTCTEPVRSLAALQALTQE